MHFAAGSWLIALILVPLLWLAVKVADRRAERRAAPQLVLAEIERRALVIQAGDIHYPRALLQKELAAGDVLVVPAD